MALDTKQPKGYRKAWNGSTTAESVVVPPREKPLGWCRAERLRTGQDVIVEETPEYTLVRCVGKFSATNLHAGKWILWDAPGNCVAVGPEEWTRKVLALRASARSEEGT